MYVAVDAAYPLAASPSRNGEQR